MGRAGPSATTTEIVKAKDVELDHLAPQVLVDLKLRESQSAKVMRIPLTVHVFLGEHLNCVLSYSVNMQWQIPFLSLRDGEIRN